MGVSKRRKIALEKVDSTQAYAIDDALSLVVITHQFKLPC